MNRADPTGYPSLLSSFARSLPTAAINTTHPAQSFYTTARPPALRTLFPPHLYLSPRHCFIHHPLDTRTRPCLLCTTRLDHAYPIASNSPLPHYIDAGQISPSPPNLTASPLPATYQPPSQQPNRPTTPPPNPSIITYTTMDDLIAGLNGGMHVSQESYDLESFKVSQLPFFPCFPDIFPQFHRSDI